MASHQPIIGFISPPRWFDPSPDEFPTVCVDPVRIQQMTLPLPEFDYGLESIAGAVDALKLCTRTLVAAGTNVVAQVGTPFAWAGVSSEAEARARCNALETAGGVPVVMTALAIVDALTALDVRRVALACTYYDSTWEDGWRSFIGCCGFQTVHAANLLDQGLVASSNPVEEHGFDMSTQLACESIRRVIDSAPGAQAVVVTGSGTRTLGLIAELEEYADRPVVGADTALYWAVARELRLDVHRTIGIMAIV